MQEKLLAFLISLTILTVGLILGLKGLLLPSIIIFYVYLGFNIVLNFCDAMIERRNKKE